MRTASVIALLVSDIHLSLKPPIWRSEEPDWLEAMKRPLKQLTELKEEYDVPILCAGDIFDKWYGAHQSSELINFALQYLPEMYAVPGQHDLPAHNYDERRRSAFWTLKKVGKINLLNHYEDTSLNLDGYRVIGVPYGMDIPSVSGSKKDTNTILVAHRYVWTAGASYPNAPVSSMIKNIPNLQDYKVAVFGDNHIGFSCKAKDTLIWNCGSFMRRHSNEADYKPRIGMLLDDGTIKTALLDTSEDKHLTSLNEKTREKEPLDISEFVKGLEKLGNSSLDFTEAIKQYVEIHKCKPSVRDILLKKTRKE